MKKLAGIGLALMVTFGVLTEQAAAAAKYFSTSKTVATFSEEALDRFYSHMDRGDQDSMTDMLENQEALVLDPGMRLFIIKKSSANFGLKNWLVRPAGYKGVKVWVRYLSISER